MHFEFENIVYFKKDPSQSKRNQNVIDEVLK